MHTVWHTCSLGSVHNKSKKDKLPQLSMCVVRSLRMENLCRLISLILLIKNKPWTKQASLFAVVLFLQIVCMIMCGQLVPVRGFRTCSIAECIFYFFLQFPTLTAGISDSATICLCSHSASPSHCESPFFIPCKRPPPRCLRIVRDPAEPIRWNAAGSRSLSLIDIPAWPLSVRSPHRRTW